MKTRLPGDIGGIERENIVSLSFSGVQFRGSTQGSTPRSTRALIMTGHIPALVASFLLISAPRDFKMTRKSLLPVLAAAFAYSLLNHCFNIMASGNSFLRVTRNVPRRNYHALNNGRSAPFSAQPVAEISEPEVQDASFDTGSNPSDSPAPFELASQPPSSSPSPPSVLEASVSSDTASDLYTPESTRRRKEKSHSSWTLQHFWVTVLDTRWSRKGGPPRNGRLLICKRCSWSSTDSARHGSTSNLLTHLQSRHRINAGSVAPLADSAVPTLDRFVRPQVDAEQALIQWVVQTRQPFIVVEHPAFKAIFQAVKADLPIKSADTLYNRVENKFVHGRDHLKQELGANCQTIALSLDVWTSEHQLAILGVIGHWITPAFDKREELLEFIEIQGPHSGENLAEIVLTMLDELVIASKLVTITGDNAGNNATLCEALQTELLKTYDDEDDPFRMKPLMRFRGRQSFIPLPRSCHQPYLQANPGVVEIGVHQRSEGHCR